jgi:serine/threonine protein kinase
MGEVYRARDTRLERTVAIKVLPADVAADPSAKERFEREARAVAALNHPHICVLHDIGRHENTDFLVLEYLEGQTLDERLSRGALSLPQALEYAVQICDALDRAHRAGIVHRDLKPRNIMLTRAGAKLLDFGLAKWRAPVASSDSGLPTRDLTAQGAIVGTLQYMAPEQLEGKEADSRADLWALGLVIHEMVTGRKAFDGKSQASLIAAILEHEPEAMDSVQPLSPPLLNRVVQRCLAKDPCERAQSAADVRSMLRWVSEGTVEARPAPGRRDRLSWALSSLLFLALLSSLGFLLYRRPPDDSPEMRLQVVTPPTTDPVSLAISPDGSRLVFVGSTEGVSRLWLRPLESETSQPLAGTEGATYPFWSPDSRSIAFFSEGKLRRIDAAGGPAQALASAARGMGGTWNRDGVIVFGIPGGPLYQVPAAGGEPAPVTRLGPLQTGHRFPQFLPDGRHFVFFAGGDELGMFVASLDSLEARRVLEADNSAVVAPGHLLFLRGETLVAQPFDSATLELSGDPFPVAEEVTFDESLGQGAVGAFSASTNGVLAYRTGSARSGRQLIWFDRAGTALPSAGVIEPSSIANPELSPDGQRVALNRIVDGNNDIWVLETARGALSRLTFDSGLDHSPLWSPDGSRLAFFSTRTGIRGLYQKLASAAGAEEPLYPISAPFLPTDWSRDGRFILCRELKPETGYDLFVMPVSLPVSERKLIPFANSIYQEREGKFSPDGKWVAYQSDESGRFEVYVQAFPGPGAKTLVSTGGGAQPRWRADGRELFYIGLDGKMMAAPITLAEDGDFLEAGTAVALFATRIAGGPILATGPMRHQYAVAPDGQRFLINVATEEAVRSPITLVLNWKPAMASKP